MFEYAFRLHGTTPSMRDVADTACGVLNQTSGSTVTSKVGSQGWAVRKTHFLSYGNFMQVAQSHAACQAQVIDHENRLIVEWSSAL